MKLAVTRRLFAILFFSGLLMFSFAQTNHETPVKPRPYRVLTSGKQVTIKSSKDIKNIMVWTASGHRIVEQKDINVNSFSFDLNVTEKIFFLMIELKGGERYTEKIGVR